MGTKVFISWSGDLSKRLAEALRRWLPCVLQNVEPYFTPEDIKKGTRWSSDITGELESSDIGVICLTKSNTTQPWILFEAGALSKRFERSKVCTVLFDLEPTDVTGPLTIFQATRFEKADFKKLVKAINSAAQENKLDDAVLDDVFDKWWPDLEQKVQAILGDQTDDTPADTRTERDMLEELLELTRLQSQGSNNQNSLAQAEVHSTSDVKFVLKLLDRVLRALGSCQRVSDFDVRELIEVMKRANIKTTVAAKRVDLWQAQLEAVNRLVDSEATGQTGIPVRDYSLREDTDSTSSPTD
ncbi:MAG: toll/interleukin-1 receptor domain-containing protein [Planctomycetota bacterium]